MERIYNMAESNGNGSTVKIKSYWLPFIALAIVQLVTWWGSYSATSAKLDSLTDQVHHIQSEVDYFLMHGGSTGGK